MHPSTSTHSELGYGTVTHPLGSATHTRRKDRMCYMHEEFNIDLTQVTSTHGNVRVRNSRDSDPRNSLTTTDHTRVGG